MNLQDTRIEKAGVMRCCLATVAKEYEGNAGDGTDDKPVELGFKSKCEHCKREFTLVAADDPPDWDKARKMYPTWKPSEWVRK